MSGGAYGAPMTARRVLSVLAGLLAILLIAPAITPPPAQTTPANLTAPKKKCKKAKKKHAAGLAKKKCKKRKR
jgi:hypothetical protein